jgi:hypothetical protein
MSPDDPSDLSAAPAPSISHKKGLSTRSMMLIVLFVAVVLGDVLHNTRSSQRAGETSHRLMSWWRQVQVDNPSISFDSLSIGEPIDWQGCYLRFKAGFKTATGRPIKIDAETRFGWFHHDGHMVISAEGRSITWPIEDAERGRKIDLKAEFPEAFR